MKKVLIISAHPDDDILGCGGLMSKYRETVDFNVIFIGEGSTCRFSNPESNQAKEAISERNSYAEKALNFLGVEKLTFFNKPCGRFDMIPLIEINKIIENEISTFKPDTIFTHSQFDNNKDHVKVYDSTMISTRPGCGVKTVYSYEVLSSSEWSFNSPFNPNVFFSLSEDNVKEKWEALSFYESEIKPFPYPRSKEGIFSNANQRGIQCGSNYAEAFTILRQFII